MIFINSLKLIKVSFFQFIGIIFLISFLLFFLNLTIGATLNVLSYSDEIRNKLGMYFYIIDDVEKKDEIYDKVIEMKTKLEQKGLEVQFISKDIALQTLKKKIPSIIESFDKYGIKNPLPATLYVIFDNEEKFQTLKDTLSSYNDYIVNIEDISKKNNFKEQEERIVNIINLTNFIVIFSYFMILVLIIIISSFIIFSIKNNFYYFYEQIIIEKLLGAYYFQIKLPFLINVILILIFSFLIMLGLYWIFFINIELYIFNVFSINIRQYLLYYKDFILNLLLFELLVILGISLLIGNFFLSNLIKKVQ